MRLLVVVPVLLVGKASAQCGPDKAKAYPPGSSTCPPKPGPGGTTGGPAPAGPGGGNTGGSTPCTSPPCAAALLGEVGLTTASGTDSRTGATFSPGENIYGPFEAGFTSTQDDILSRLGCSSGKGYVAGGVDTITAEQMMAHDCGVQLPRIEAGKYVSLLDECGGHTIEYHFHERMNCLYDEGAGSGHSTAVGTGADGRKLYGKWEDFSQSELPKLDACGGHFGITPDSDQPRYHYHIQAKAPFTFGCFGPKPNGDNKWKMLTLAECRALYPGCGDNDQTTLTTASGSFQYDLWCPCYDADGSNVATKELPIFAEAESSWTCEGLSCAAATAQSNLASSTTVTKSLLGTWVALMLSLLLAPLPGVAAE